jgi:hypothetical protein
MNQNTPSYSMSMFRDWEAAVPFLGQLPSILCDLDSSLGLKRAGQFIRQKI